MSTFGAFSVVRSTVKRVLNSSGVLAQVAINTPAFEFNSDGTYRGLLVEPAATNLLQRSAEFDNAYWTKNTSTITANATVAPDGTTTADKLIGDNLATIASMERLTTGVTASASHTVSVFYKASEASWIRIVASAVTGTSPARVWFNASTGAVGTNNGGFSRATTTSYGNGWYRAEATFVTSGTNITVFFGLADADNSNNYAGNGTDGAFFWGAQLETGSVATSYIPTVASTANRTADSVTLTGASSLIGQTEGTIYAEAIFNGVASAVFARAIAVASDATNVIYIGVNASTIRGFITVAGVDTQGGTMAESASSNTVHKMAIAYKVGTGNGALYVNGAGDITNPTAIPSMDKIYLGSNPAGTVGVVGWYRSLVLFPSRLANATLATLTTL